MYLLYRFTMRIFSSALFLYGLFKPEIALWNTTRDKHFDTLPDLKKRAGSKKVVWMHCASLGEFEQGVALLRKIRECFPDVFILLTFFSPSGYLQKKTSHGSRRSELPADRYQKKHG